MTLAAMWNLLEAEGPRPVVYALVLLVATAVLGLATSAVLRAAGESV